VLRGSNKEVVLKVLKPGTEDTLVTDLNFVGGWWCGRGGLQQRKGAG
jgi:hypothetical protein